MHLCIIMRITVDIPRELLQKAKKFSGAPTKTKTIIQALEAMIQKHELSEIKKYFGKIDLDLDLDKLRDHK